MKIYQYKIVNIIIFQFLIFMTIRETIANKITHANISSILAPGNNNNKITIYSEFPSSKCLNIQHISRNFQALFQPIRLKYSLKDCDDFGKVYHDDDYVIYNGIYDPSSKNKLIAELRYRPFNGLTKSIITTVIKSTTMADYLYDNVNDGSEDGNNSRIGYGRLLGSTKIDLSHLNGTIYFAEFECWKLNRFGYYGIGIFSADNSTIINEINWLKLNETEKSPNRKASMKPLTLWLRNDSIFPSCVDDLTLSFSLPQGCDASKLYDLLDFRIRMYASAIPPGSDASNSLRETELFHAERGTVSRNNYRNKDEARWIYIGEFAIKNERTSGTFLLTIPCANFDIIHEKFCFELISVERITRHFEHWDRKCVSTEPEVSAGLIADSSSDLGMSSISAWGQSSWSEWTEWTSCIWRSIKKEGKINKKQKFHCEFSTKFHGNIDSTIVPSSISRLGYRKRHRKCILTSFHSSPPPSSSSSAMLAHKSSNACGKNSLIQHECCEILDDTTTYRNFSSESNDQPKSSNNNTLFSSTRNANSIRTNTVTCECGCKLSDFFKSSTKGAFFIGSELCKDTVIKWELLLQIEDDNNHMVELKIVDKSKSHNLATLRIFRDEDLIWSSESLESTWNKPAITSVLLVEEFGRSERINFYFFTNNNNTKRRLGGFYIEFQIYIDLLAKFKLSSSSNYISAMAFSPLRIFIGALLLKLNILEECNLVDKYSDTFPMPSTNLQPILSSKQQKCDDIVTILAWICAVITVIIILFIPLMVCVLLTRHFAIKNWSKQRSSLFVPYAAMQTIGESANNAALNSSSSRHSLEMLRSGDTDSTQITETKTFGSNKVNKIQNLDETRQFLPKTQLSTGDEVKIVSKRSIGIQLSRQSTPRLTSRNNNIKEDSDINNNNSSKNNNGRKVRQKRMDTTLLSREVVTANGAGSSASNSAAQTTIDDFGDEEDGVEYGTESGTDGFEYDYYEPPHPLTSFLRPHLYRLPNTAIGTEQDFELVSEIDIDEIVRNEATTINDRWHEGTKWLKSERHVGTMMTQDAHTQISDLL